MSRAIAVQVLDSDLQEAAWSLEGFPKRRHTRAALRGVAVLE
jgi:hypothetical protein